MKRSRFVMSTCETNPWILSFVLVSDKPKVYARHILTGEKLVAPRDNERLCEIVPAELWPSFAQSLLDINVNPNQERLFS